jgi:hypothetical protein
VSHADDVRKYCKDNKIDHARRKGETQIEIRVGDIHTEMNYKNRMPLVSAALGASKFESYAQVERISLAGPTNGANAVFTFRIK